jgi:hypothetical protein
VSACPGPAFNQYANTESLELGGDFGDDGNTGFFGSGFREDTDDDSHAKLSQA